jgi:hypothetical protein
VFFHYLTDTPHKSLKLLTLCALSVELHPRGGDDRSRTYYLWFRRPKSV